MSKFFHVVHELSPEERVYNAANEPLNKAPKSGIDVVIAGGGIGGLTAALECYRQGHNVRVFERNAAMSAAGCSPLPSKQPLNPKENYKGIRNKTKEVGQS